MAIQRVKERFATLGIADRIREFDVSSATVELAAVALGTKPERIAKSMSFDVDGETVIVVTAGDAKIDNHKFKEFFKTKAKMLSFDEVEARV
ncbi:MAG: YbaK/EbsC family protein, partial [Clostridia bacterium]|nr:YbaK/EbsC family protein [Clostridia bacterium]